jgi:hypothetical protein
MLQQCQHITLIELTCLLLLTTCFQQYCKKICYFFLSFLQVSWFHVINLFLGRLQQEVSSLISSDKMDTAKYLKMLHLLWPATSHWENFTTSWATPRFKTGVSIFSQEGGLADMCSWMASLQPRINTLWLKERLSNVVTNNLQSAVASVHVRLRKCADNVGVQCGNLICSA